MTSKTLLKLLPIYLGVIGVFVYFIQEQQPKDINAAFITEDQVWDSIVKLRAKAPNVDNAPHHIKFGIPKELFIPRIGLTVPLTAGEYYTETSAWNVSSTHAHFATISALPNDHSGNTVIYGHNSKEIFAQLFSLNVGDLVEIKTVDNLTFVYKMRDTARVRPDEVSVLDTTNLPQLTLLTCEGTWNEHRRLVYFDLLEVRS